MRTPVLENHYGKEVWTNRFMDDLRRKECLCLNCEIQKDCTVAASLFNICKNDNLALAVTRCKNYKGV